MKRSWSKEAWFVFVWMLTLVILLASVACEDELLPTHTVSPDPSRLATNEYGQLVSSVQILMYFRDGVSEEEVLASIQRCGASVVGRIPEIGLWQVQIENPDNNSTTLREYMQRCEAENSVDHVFMNSVGYEDLVPQDGFAWADPDNGWSLQKIGMIDAWDITTGDPDVVIGVVDGRFDIEHPDFVADSAKGLSSRICHHEILGSSYDKNVTNQRMVERKQHGTHVAGIIGARGNNGIGVAGINWQSCLRLYGVRSFSPREEEEEGIIFTSDYMQGVFNAARDGAFVINMSIGIPWERRVDDGGNPIPVYPYDNAWEDHIGESYPDQGWLMGEARRWRPVIRYLAKARSGRGVLLVVSAGNSSNPERSDPRERIINAKWTGGPILLNTDEEFYDNVMVVASVGSPENGQQDDQGNEPLFREWSDRWSELSWFSSAGEYVDVAAPGGAILSTMPTHEERDIGYMSGTSMAAPFVTGLASLLFSLDSNLTAGEVKDLIISGAERGGVQVQGHPFYIINAIESLRLLTSSMDNDCGGELGSDIRITDAARGSWHPSLVWTGSEYGMAWRDGRNGNGEIYFTRLDATGAKIDTEVRIADAPGQLVCPSLVWTGSEYGVAWSDSRNDNTEIYFTRISATGTKLGSDVRITEAAEISRLSSLVWTGSEYGVAWEDYREGTSKVYFTRLSASGIKLDSDISIADTINSGSPSLVWIGSEYGVAWSDGRDGSSEIYFARLDVTGTRLGADIRITDAPEDSGGPSLVWNGSEYGVAWHDRRDGNFNIYFTRISATGTRLGSDVRITDMAVWALYPSLMWNGSGYGVAWDDELNDACFDEGYDCREIYFAHLDARGTKLNTSISITDTFRNSQRPSLVWTDVEYGVAWHDERDNNNDEIYFTRIDGCL